MAGQAAQIEGIVVKSTGSWYTVFDPATGQRSRCRIRGVFRLRGSRTTNPVTVGDRVKAEIGADEGDNVITEILPRTNYIIRRASNLSKESHIIAANIDTAYLVATLDRPPTSTEFIDRFLVTAEAYHIPSVILLNKMDLFAGPEFREIIDELAGTYRNAGYEVLEISAKTGMGIDELRARMQNKTSLFTGNSGVGKSTLINAIEPGLDLKTGAISDYHHKGKHTTTFSEIFPLTGGGMLIDTPGIKGFGLVDIAPDELARYFPDLFRLAPHCQYYNCTHTHEPNCAVTAAVAAGEIAGSRYVSYLKMLEDDDKDGKYRK
ncbi:ribosome small subunit-dependent GTPase A [uncultured Rikenella sp.]|uniref:ribosome small subunit-dependent GTPase A n=1 Tax=uncultured Rikenella sp. TaxID=368003 RepID=UPI0026124835|nr:ribosome small subunit-dependent GTPase A [uncultured Rikenella sp.]